MTLRKDSHEMLFQREVNFLMVEIAATDGNRRRVQLMDRENYILIKRGGGSP